MIRGYSAEQVREAEAPLLAAGVPLMRRAAAGLADEIRRVLAERSRPASDPGNAEGEDALAGHPEAARVVLLVGSGNNGGDALYAGAELAAEGVSVAIVSTGNHVHEAGLAAALTAGAHREPAEADRVSRLAAEADIVVDAILGTGSSANPALRGLAREIVAAIRPVVAGGFPRPHVVAVDIPSGTNPNDGSVPDATVLPADVTVTFGGCKAGLLLRPASELAGRVRLVDIGLGARLAGMQPLVSAPDPRL